MADKEVQVRKEKQEKREERWLRPYSTIREEDDGRIIVQLEMPGVSKEGLSIEVENRELRITGRRREAPAPEGEYLIRERRDGSYYRAFTLDETVDPEKIEAVVEGGVLTITLQRKESEKPRKITVKAG